MIFFTHPKYLYLFLLLIIFIFRFVFDFINLKNIFYGSRLNFIRKKVILKNIFYGLAFTFLIFAFAEVNIGRKKNSAKQSGTELFFLLDISKSMSVKDTVSSRLDIAKALIKIINVNIDTVPAGLILFKGKAILSIPMTRDKTIFDSILSQVSPNSFTTHGSNLQNAINFAINKFSDAESIRKMIILITDGDESSGSFNNASTNVRDKNIHCICIGVGTNSGAAIKIYDEHKNEKEITTRLAEENLKAFIKNLDDSQSVYFKYDEINIAEKIISIIKKNNQSTTIIINEKQSRTGECLFLCVLFLFVGFIFGEHEWVKK